MRNVKVLSEEKDGASSAKVNVELGNGETLTVRNCHLVSKTYFGTVEINGGSEGVKYESVFLSMDGNGDGLITLNEI